MTGKAKGEKKGATKAAALGKGYGKVSGKLPVGIIGASGYTGYELIKLLARHPKVDLKVLNSNTYAGQQVKSLYPDFFGSLRFTDYPMDMVNAMVNVLFLALPHKAAMEAVHQTAKGVKIVDLSADYRFDDRKLYEKEYGVKHIDHLQAQYGLPELFKAKIRKAGFVANPGCYVTASILAGFPAQKFAQSIIFDCKSGWAGAGRNSAYAKDNSLTKDNINAYKLTTHRHKHEIQQFFSIPISFTPHVIDTFRGIMATAHIQLRKGMKREDIVRAYEQFYKGQPFVKILPEGIPSLHDVQNTNFCHIGGFESDEHNQLVVVSVLDNLVKGASGQAVQNTNLMMGWGERLGLE